jgi:hypothetical protein
MDQIREWRIPKSRVLRVSEDNCNRKGRGRMKPGRRNLLRLAKIARQRNNNYNLSASPSMAWARRDSDRRAVARTRRNARQESKTKLLKPSFRVTSHRFYALPQ